MALRTSAQHELGRRVGGRRIVGTMNLRMAVHAAAALPDVDNVFAAGNVGDQRCGLAGRRWPEHAGLAPDCTDAACYVRRMALLAQQGRARFEHRRDRAAVRVVAD